MEATITYDGTSHEWKTSGKAYPSENLYLGGTVLAFEETPSFWVRSFKIEEDAKPALLLPANQDLAETTVIKAALIDKATGSLLYVEDEFRNSDIVAAIQAVSETPTRAEAISQEAYEHSLNVIWLADSWFYHYLPEPKRLPDHEARLIDQLVVGIEKLPTELQEPLNEIVVFFIEHLQENQRKDGRP
ncbi:hypothetical protein [Aureibacillus halotolerans]|uniref:hypothetical protein n=1 Tax=Aureibacillus halotolerans TaxID=1508390 RepID=UPI00105E3ED4|nr:hypothetical protein [Aureibacillus halotolerans]